MMAAGRRERPGSSNLYFDSSVPSKLAPTDFTCFSHFPNQKLTSRHAAIMTFAGLQRLAEIAAFLASSQLIHPRLLSVRFWHSLRRKP